LRKPSAYADRGTALHEAMALLLDDDAPPLESFAGKTSGAYTITADDVENALRPALTYIIELLDGAEFYLEHRVVFPTIANTFGTADLIVRIGRTIHVVDLKFGVGVRVLALYPRGEADTYNPQLLFWQRQRPRILFRAAGMAYETRPYISITQQLRLSAHRHHVRCPALDCRHDMSGPARERCGNLALIAILVVNRFDRAGAMVPNATLSHVRPDADLGQPAAHGAPPVVQRPRGERPVHGRFLPRPCRAPLCTLGGYLQGSRCEL
jgi:hypothetical protein